MDTFKSRKDDKKILKESSNEELLLKIIDSCLDLYKQNELQFVEITEFSNVIIFTGHQISNRNKNPAQVTINGSKQKASYSYNISFEIYFTNDNDDSAVNIRYNSDVSYTYEAKLNNTYYNKYYKILIEILKYENEKKLESIYSSLLKDFNLTRKNNLDNILG